jgi:hypothetical protein
MSEAVRRVEEYCAKAGMKPDSPLRLALLNVMETAETAREAVKGGARGLTPEGERELIKRITEAVVDTTEREAERIVRRFDLMMVLKVAVALAAFVLISFTGGYWMGQRDTALAGQQLAQALEDDPSAARLWLNLIRNNDLKGALQKCRGGASWQANGRRACNIPLWLESGRTTP